MEKSRAKKSVGNLALIVFMYIMSAVCFAVGSFIVVDGITKIVNTLSRYSISESNAPSDIDTSIVVEDYVVSFE